MWTHKALLTAFTAAAAVMALTGHDAMAVLAGLATNQYWIWSD